MHNYLALTRTHSDHLLRAHPLNRPRDERRTDRHPPQLQTEQRQTQHTRKLPQGQPVRPGKTAYGREGGV